MAHDNLNAISCVSVSFAHFPVIFIAASIDCLTSSFMFILLTPVCLLIRFNEVIIVLTQIANIDINHTLVNS